MVVGKVVVSGTKAVKGFINTHFVHSLQSLKVFLYVVQKPEQEGTSQSVGFLPQTEVSVEKESKKV